MYLASPSAFLDTVSMEASPRVCSQSPEAGRTSVQASSAEAGVGPEHCTRHFGLNSLGSTKVRSHAGSMWHTSQPMTTASFNLTPTPHRRRTMGFFFPVPFRCLTPRTREQSTLAKPRPAPKTVNTVQVFYRLLATSTTSTTRA